MSVSPFYTFIFLLTILRTQLILASNATRPHRQLSVDYYANTCPHVEELIGSMTSQRFHESPVSGPATIRLFFHDCFVDGCDGSVLVSTRPGSKELAERDAQNNKDLRNEAYDSITKAKALVETKCPGVVSCADILAISARDFVHLAGGPYYQVKKGRWDGKISMASRVHLSIPRSNSTIDELIKLFNSKGLNLNDLVVLSGAHSIGFAHCNQFLSRLYDYRGSKKPDPTIDSRLLKALKLSCPYFGGNLDVVIPFDVTTPFSFDNAYYGNLENKLGILATDQALFLDPRTKPIVQDLAQDKQKFFQEFALAMEKMGSIGVKRGKRHGGGPYYQVKKGRWDGKISMASRVHLSIPRSNSTIDELIKLFNSKWLNLNDLVVLSGAHTIGFAHCNQFLSRLYDYRGSKKPDPTIDSRLLKALKLSCPYFGGNLDVVIPFDVTTPFSFDNAYYGNLENKLGILATDQALFLDPRTKPIVQDLAQDKQKFFQEFALAMEKMGSIGVKRGKRHGEKRKDCSAHAL